MNDPISRFSHTRDSAQLHDRINKMVDETNTALNGHDISIGALQTQVAALQAALAKLQNAD